MRGFSLAPAVQAGLVLALAAAADVGNPVSVKLRSASTPDQRVSINRAHLRSKRASSPIKVPLTDWISSADLQVGQLEGRTGRRLGGPTKRAVS